MFRTHRLPLIAAALAVGATSAMYAALGQPRPFLQWNWIDIASESAIAAMACLWFVLVLSSRPPGRVTSLLAAGLAGLMVGAWADCMDEFLVIAKGQHWNHLIESGSTMAGMISLTWGLLYWRQEQFMVTEHLQKRERLFRDHRSFDALTQVGDADYLREQLRIESASGAAGGCTLLMFDIDSFHVVNRLHGQREGDRLLQAVTHTLLLNVRNTDLLCRYAGDRFALLVGARPADALDDTELGATAAEDAAAIDALGEHLRRAVACLRHHTQAGAAIEVTMRVAARPVGADPRQLLKDLNAALERRMAQPPADESEERKHDRRQHQDQSQDQRGGRQRYPAPA